MAVARAAQVEVSSRSVEWVVAGRVEQVAQEVQGQAESVQREEYRPDWVSLELRRGSD